MTERERLIELLKSDNRESPMLCDQNCNLDGKTYTFAKEYGEYDTRKSVICDD